MKAETQRTPEATPPGCFHCGLPLPAGTAFGFDGDAGWRSFCCAGCEAVSRAITGLGLDDYYRLRDSPAAPPAPDAPGLTAFDDPAVQARFVRALPDGSAEAELVMEGMRCAACAWLLERALRAKEGVLALDVSFATRRARLRWDSRKTRLSEVLGHVRSIGYRAWPYEPGRLALVEKGERRALLRRLWVAGLAMMQVMMYALPAYVAGDGDMTADIAQLMRWSGLFLTLPVIAYSAAPFLAGAWRDLRNRRAGMDVPVAIAIAVAFAASAWATFAAQGDVYFDSVTMFVFLLLGARYLELVARDRAGDALQHLGRLVPLVARRLGREGNDTIEEVPAARLAAGDRVLVRAGETAPADGTLESAHALVGEAWLSGESRPLARARGDCILEASVNLGNPFVFRVERVGEATSLSAIQRMMERAQGDRPRWVEAAQRAASLFVVAILALAAAAGLAWLAIDAGRAPWVAVAVLVVTCPCALALATPLAITAATGALARANVVVTRASAVEALAGATDVVLDKTGTMTHGRPRLLHVVALGDRDGEACLALAARLSRWSTHPHDRALVEAAPATGTPLDEPPTSAPGAGLEAIAEGRRVRLGSAAFVQGLHGLASPLSWLHGAESSVFLGDERGWIAAFRLGDEIRPEAREAVAALRALGLRVHLLSGDSLPAAEAVARDLDIGDVVAPAGPGEKLRYVRSLQRRGARVAMVGDGINDAPVLAQADVSIAMGGGCDLAQIGADAVLLSDSPADLARAFGIARKARRIVRQNLAWALGYNLVAIPVAFAGLVTPLVAGIGMSASSLLVVANALRLRVRPSVAVPGRANSRSFDERQTISPHTR